MSTVTAAAKPKGPIGRAVEAVADTILPMAAYRHLVRDVAEGIDVGPVRREAVLQRVCRSAGLFQADVGQYKLAVRVQEAHAAVADAQAKLPDALNRQRAAEREFRAVEQEARRVCEETIDAARAPLAAAGQAVQELRDAITDGQTTANLHGGRLMNPDYQDRVDAIGRQISDRSRSIEALQRDVARAQRYRAELVSFRARPWEPLWPRPVWLPDRAEGRPGYDRLPMTESELNTAIAIIEGEEAKIKGWQRELESIPGQVARLQVEEARIRAEGITPAHCRLADQPLDEPREFVPLGGNRMAV